MGEVRRFMFRTDSKHPTLGCTATWRPYGSSEGSGIRCTKAGVYVRDFAANIEVENHAYEVMFCLRLAWRLHECLRTSPDKTYDDDELKWMIHVEDKDE